MRYVIPCVEQLDRAAKELHEKNAVNSRLALILIDNVVELVCHRRCKDLIDCDGGSSWADNPRYPHRQRRRVLGRFFDQKISFLRGEQLLAEEEREFILIAHEHRNKAYHIGLRDDSIIWSLAWHYHKLGCDLFGRLQPRWMGSTSSDPYTARVKFHLRNIGSRGALALFPDFQKLAESLSGVRPPTDRSLGVVLSEALLDELEELESQVEFLVTDNPTKMKKPEIVRHVQWYADLQAELDKTELFPSDQSYQKEVRRIRKLMDSTWKPKYEHLPIDSWRRRARELAREDSFLKALKKFESVRTDKNYLVEVIGEAASELDAHIQMEIDQARGK